MEGPFEQGAYADIIIMRTCFRKGPFCGDFLPARGIVLLARFRRIGTGDATAHRGQQAASGEAGRDSSSLSSSANVPALASSLATVPPSSAF